MHITIMAVGSRGDVQPFVALGVGLKGEGHVVRIATHDIHSKLVLDHGLEFASTGGDPREMLRTLTGQAWLNSGRNLVAFWRRFWKLVGATIEESFSCAEEACRGTEAVLFTFFGAPGYHVAEQLGVPHAMGLLQPFTRTRAFPYCLAPAATLGGTLNWWSYVLAEQVAWLAGRKWTNRWRTQSLGLDALPWRTPFSHLYATGEPFIYGFSEHVVPRPRDWPPTHEITGYWFLDEDSNWSPPPDLADFLSSGPPPVYVGFGSMTGQVAEELTAVALEAVTLAERRAVLVGGWATLVDRDLPDTVFAMDAVPHRWLFPRMAAVVHHGGAGTTAAGLRAGVPTVVVPFFADQPFWGGRVHALGAGPKPLPRKRLTSQKLAAAITHAASDPEIGRRASRIGDKLRAEDGVGRAVERVIAYLSAA
ncbi:MAG: glycosyltransferase [Gemmatimonadales bacterium]